MGQSRLTHQVHRISTDLGSYHLEGGRKKVREGEKGRKEERDREREGRRGGRGKREKEEDEEEEEEGRWVRSVDLFKLHSKDN